MLIEKEELQLWGWAQALVSAVTDPPANAEVEQQWVSRVSLRKSTGLSVIEMTALTTRTQRIIVLAHRKEPA